MFNFSLLFLLLLPFIVIINGQLPDEALSDTTALQDIVVLGSHNSYKVRPKDDLYDLYKVFGEYQNINSYLAWDYTHVELKDQFDYQNIRSVELDIAYDPSGGLFAQHQTYQLLNKDVNSTFDDMRDPGYKCFHIQDVDFNTTCRTFKKCITRIRDWLIQNPTSVPISILLEVKTEDYKIEDPLKLGFAIPVNPDYTALETEIKEVFTNLSMLLTPADVVNAAGGGGTLKDAITTSGWPTLASTRGKAMFVLTNDVGNYTFNLATSLMFPNVESTSDNAAVMLMNDPFDTNIEAMVKQNFLVRTRTDVDTYEARTGNTTNRDAALKSGAQLISTDYPRKLLTGNLVPESILQTGYNVYLPPSCNNITSSTCDSRLLIPTQNATTEPKPLPLPIDTEDLFGNGSIGFNYDNSTFSFLDSWANLLGINITAIPIDDYLKSLYSPRSFVLDMHSFPRAGSSRDFNVENSDYWKGIIGIGIGFVSLAIIFAIITPFVFCKCGCKCRRSKVDARKKKNWWFVGGAIFLIVVAIIGCICAIVGDQRFAKALRETNDFLGKLQSILQTLESIVPTISGAVDAVNKFINSTIETCPDVFGASQDNITEFFKSIEQYADDAANATKDLGSNDLSSLMDSVDEINAIHQALVLMFVLVIVLIVVFFSIALFMSPAMSKRYSNSGVREKLVKYLTIPTCVFSIVIIVIIMALLIVLSVLSSDFCIDPDSNIVTLVSDGSKNFTETMVTCPTDRIYVNFQNKEGQFVVRMQDMTPIYNVSANLCPTFPNRTDYLETLNAKFIPSIERLGSLVLDLMFILRCKTITSLYSQVIHNIICSYISEALILLWIGLLLIAFAMSGLIWVYGAMAITTVDELGEYHKTSLVPPSSDTNFNSDHQDGDVFEMSSKSGTIGGSRVVIAKPVATTE